MNDATYITKRRRALQILWSCLDRHLVPCLKDGVVLAVSGGPDSRALLESVALWRGRSQGRIVVACVDHGARLEAQGEARFIAMRAMRLGFAAHTERIINIDGEGSEQYLRIARLRALSKIAQETQCQTICTAHHADDDAEGYFMALMGVGGGELGAAMNEITMLEDMRICRPFLSRSKQDLLLALSLCGITDFVEDRLDEACLGMRARVRNQIFPELFKKAPMLRSRLAQFGRHQSSQRELIERLASSLIAWGDKEASLSLDNAPDKALIIAALWQVLKKWCNDKDLRSSQPTINALVNDLPAVYNPWLDPISNAFNLKDLSVRHYQFPGVVVTKSSKNIVIARI